VFAFIKVLPLNPVHHVKQVTAVDHIPAVV